MDSDNLLKLVERWSNKLDEQDFANIGGMLIGENIYSEAIYFLRLATNAVGDTISQKTAVNLATYYNRRNRPAASLFYYSHLSPDELKEGNPKYYEAVMEWKEKGCLQDSLRVILSIARQHIFNNAITLIKEGNLRGARQEFIASKKLGVDSLRVNKWLEMIDKMKMQNSIETAPLQDGS